MRYSFRTLAAPFALAIMAGSCSTAMAQQKQPRPGTTNPTSVPVQQTNAQMRIQQPPLQKPAPPAEKIPPALQTILDDWEEQSSKIKSLHGKHTRTVYNLVFQEERVAKGKFFLQTPDKGRIDLAGEAPKGEAKSSRLGQDGKPFKLLADRAERWICTGNEIVMVNDEEKTFEVIPLPEEAKGTNIINTPLPFLFGMKSEEAKRRFHITLSKETKDTAILIIVPRLDSDKQNYAQAFVILDKTTYLPTAVKLFDPAGSLETVYKFESVQVNDKGFIKAVTTFWARDKDPYRPNLKGEGYKLVLPTPEEMEAPRKGTSNDSRVVPQSNRPTSAPGAQSALPRPNPASLKK